MAGAESWDLDLHCVRGKLVQKFRVKKMLQWWKPETRFADKHPNRKVNKQALLEVSKLI